MTKGALSDAIAACRQAAADRPNVTLYKYLHAFALEQAGKTDQAATLYHDLATNGDAIAQYQLGSMYLKGVGVQRDTDKAYQWYAKAADQNHAAAQLGLGAIHSDIQSQYANLERSAFWTRKSAENGNSQAEYKMFEIKSQGLGENKDSAEAKNWLEKSAQQGYAVAQFKLGEMRHSASAQARTSIDPALRLFSLSAEQGYGPAQMRLGIMYDRGIGVTSDDQKAISWYRKAALNGESGASERLAALTEAKPASQVTSREATSNSTENSSSSNWIWWLIGGVVLVKLLGKSKIHPNKAGGKQKSLGTTCGRCGGMGARFQQPYELCAYCSGFGCSSCSGGRNSSRRVKCESCRGTGTIE